MPDFQIRSFFRIIFKTVCFGIAAGCVFSTEVSSAANQVSSNRKALKMNSTDTRNAGPQITAADIDLIIRNYNRINPPAEADIARARAILADQNSDGSFKSIQYKDATRGNWLGIKHWSNMHILVGAWHATRDPEYRSAVIAGLEFWGKTLPENPNWWWQFIGAPYNVIRVINNMYGEIPPETLEVMRRCFDRSDIFSMRNLYEEGNIDPALLPDRIALTEILLYAPASPLAGECRVKYTGQNLVDTAIIRMWKGIYFKNAEFLFSGIEEVFSEVVVAGSRPPLPFDMPEVDRLWMNPGLEGIQTDYSFHQHGAQQQFGVYGSAYFINIIKFMDLFTGTPLVLPAEKVELMNKYFINGISWTLYKKQFDILACGRELIKDYPWKKYENIARTIECSAKNLKPQLQSAEKDLSGSNYFYRSDYLIHRRENRFFSFKMCSKRVRGSESTNFDNMQGLYLGCGVMQYKITGSEYDGMPALWDWRRLPGLTAVYDEGSLLAQPDINRSPAVGGVSDGINSGVMLNMAQEGKLEYNKSAATFDSAVVFTLSDVKNKTSFPVNTTIDSKRFTTPVKAVFSDGKLQSFSSGIHHLQQVSRIVCGETAYTFLKAVDITLEITDKTVAWNTVTIWADGSFSGKSATFYLTGTQPASYIVHPAGEEVESIKSMIQADFYHAVTDEKSNIKYIFFFAPGEADIPGIGKVSSNAKAAVMITENQILLAETLQNGSPVEFSLNGKTYSFSAPGGLQAGKSSALMR